MYAAIFYYFNSIYLQVNCFKLLYLEQVTSSYSEGLYLWQNHYYFKNEVKTYNQIFHSLSIIECTLRYQDINVTLCLLQIYLSGKPLFKSQGLVKLTLKQLLLWQNQLRGMHEKIKKIELRAIKWNWWELGKRRIWR